MAKKTFTAAIKLLEADDDRPDGSFRSVFAQFDVEDHDGDVTHPGAFHEGQSVVVEGWNHDYGLPVGKATIHQDEQYAWVDGQFFLDTQQGREHYLTLRSLGGIEEWSYTFMVEEAETGVFNEEKVRFLNRLDVWGVAPVTRGAGVGTRTLDLKSLVGLSDADVARLKALLKGDSPSGDNGGEDSEGRQDVGDPGGDGGEAGDGKPSAAPGVGVVLAEIELITLEV